MWSKFFPTKNKSPDDVVKSLRDSLRQAAAPGDARAVKKKRDDVSKAILAMKHMLFGDPGNDVDVKPEDVTELVRLACDSDLLLLIAQNLSSMEFETRKDAVQIFNNLLRRDADIEASAEGEAPPYKCAVAKVAEKNGEILKTLVEGYENGDIALNCGHILRECIRHEELASLLLQTELFWTFFKLVEVSDFDVASDAFSTFKDCLVRHAAISARFIQANMDRFVASYNSLLRSPNYVTRRQSLKLLGELLLERTNFRIMTHYIGSASNLRLIMNLLLDNRKNIQFEAFHVFKIFVANPKKPPDVAQILARNKERMLDYLKDFLSDRDDDQFQEDRQLVLNEIRMLQPPEPQGSSVETPTAEATWYTLVRYSSLPVFAATSETACYQ